KPTLAGPDLRAAVYPPPVHHNGDSRGIRHRWLICLLDRVTPSAPGSVWRLASILRALVRAERTCPDCGSPNQCTSTQKASTWIHTAARIDRVGADQWCNDSRHGF